METEEQPNLIQRLINKVDGKEVTALGGEIGTGIGLDMATQKLLYLGPKGWVAYGGINFLGGAGANYAAQQYRTEEDLAWYDRDWGEIISSGLLGIIPGTTAKAGKLTPFVGRPNTYRRAATFGATQGVTDQFIRQGINEQRLPTAGEIATGGITGGVAGPVFKKSFDEIGKIFTKYQGKSAKEINDLLTDEEINTLKTLLGSKEPLSREDETTVRSLIKKLNTEDLPIEEAMAEEGIWSSEALPDDIRVIYHRGDITTQLSSGKRIFPWENPSGMTKQTQPTPRGASRDFAKRWLIAGNTAGDIDLRNYDFQNNPEDYRNFELLIQKLLQDDDIRVQDIPYLAREGNTPIMGSRTEGTKGENLKTVREIYNDYLVGYFNRWIRSGVKNDFNDAARLITPSGQTVGGNATLLREMKLFIMAPDVYRPDAFKASSEPYRNQLADILNDLGIQDRRRFLEKIRAHHIQMIDEGWPLFRGLPSEQIPVMRQLLERHGLFTGNDPKNLLLILDKYHKRLHNKYWPMFKPNWDVDAIYRIKNAVDRKRYADEYAEAVKNTMAAIENDIEKMYRVKFRQKFSQGKRLSERRMETLIEGIAPEELYGE